MPSTAFVTGVTGTQGGAVARELLQRGWNVHALIRTQGTDRVIYLESLGVKTFHGDWDNAESIQVALVGCTAVFMAMKPDFLDPDAELRQAKLILATAKAVGVTIVVCSTGVASNKPEQLYCWDPDTLFAKFMLSKQMIEESVRSAGFPNYAILRPGFFMANFLQPKVGMYHGLRERGLWTSALEADSRLGMIDERDIATFAAAAMEDPERFDGQEIALAGQVLTPVEIMEHLSAASGRSLTVSFVPDHEVEAHKSSNPLVMGALAIREMMRFIDMDKVNSFGIPLGTFERYLSRERENVTKTYF